MDALKFTLGGRFAFFKKPDVNTYLYFTYGNVHKVVLLGIFGAILGYDGYNQMSFGEKYKKDFKGIAGDKEYIYPEFYNRLKNLKVSIVPEKISIPKKVQVFNNSVGYASEEQGGNLIVNEQWLENPSWDIYIAIEDEEGEKLSRALMEKNFVYLPYLGTNDHPADISEVMLFHEVSENDSFKNVDSLFIKEDFEFIEYDDLDDEVPPIFKYEEKLPYSLEESTNKYEFKSFIYTNANLRKLNNIKVYKIGGKNIVFI